MKTPLEHPLSTPHEILTTDPIVSINLGVKHKLNPGEVFEVDYDSLRSTLKELGAPADNSNLSIEYTPRINGLASPSGLYNSDEQSIQVKTTRNAARMQRFLQHEIGHHVDISQSPLTPKDIKRNRLGSLSTAAQQVMLPPSAVASGTSLAPYLIEHEHIPAVEMIQNVAEAANFALAPLLLGTVALSMAFYYGHPREIIARKAQKKSAPIVARIK